MVREGFDNNNMSAPIVKLVDYFEGGQRCDETNAPRRAEVSIQCCQNVNNQRAKYSPPNKNQKKSSSKLAVISDIYEPNTCSYQINVCSELLCHELVSPAKGSSKDSLSSVLDNLHGKCVTRQEDWWTYELCFGKGVRQYHAQAVPIPTDEKSAPGIDGTVVDESPRQAVTNAPKKAVKLAMKVVSEYSLGNASTSELNSKNANPRIVRKQEGISIGLDGTKKNNTMATVQFELTDGTSCDLKNLSRASTVELLCGKQLGYKAVEIIDIMEDSTCHYLIKVNVPDLCLIELFAPKTQKMQRMECVLLTTLYEYSSSNLPHLSVDGSDGRPDELFASQNDFDSSDDEEEEQHESTGHLKKNYKREVGNTVVA